MRMITRTVTTYRHIYGKVVFVDGKPTVEIVGEVTFPKKLGSRQWKKFLEENGMEKELQVITTEGVNTLYGCTLDKFLEIAEPIKSNENNDN